MMMISSSCRDHSCPEAPVEDLRAHLLPPAVHSLQSTHWVNSGVLKTSAGLSAALFPSKVLWALPSSDLLQRLLVFSRGVVSKQCLESKFFPK